MPRARQHRAGAGRSQPPTAEATRHHGRGQERPPPEAALVAMQQAVGNRAAIQLFAQAPHGVTTAVGHLQRDVAVDQLTSIRMSDSARLQSAFRNSPPLKRGDPDRDAVTRVQQTLLDDGFSLPRSMVTHEITEHDEREDQTLDGIFGGETFTTIKAFQRKHELADDGIVGHDTLTALDAVASHRTPSGEPMAAPLAEGQAFRQFTREEYIELWERKYGRRMTAAERRQLAAGCIGITAVNLQGASGVPPLGLSFGTFARARSVADALNRIVGAATALDELTPEAVAAEPELANLQNVIESLPVTGSPDQWRAVIFSKRFYSNQAEDWYERIEADPDAFLPDEDTGQVDMSGYQYRGRPDTDEGRRPGYSEFTNFDYGWWDDETDTWWHANHAEPDMEVYQSTLEHYSRPLRDFDRQVFSVAFARRV